MIVITRLIMSRLELCRSFVDGMAKIDNSVKVINFITKLGKIIYIQTQIYTFGLK